MGSKNSGRMAREKSVLPTKVRPGWLRKLDQRSVIARTLLVRLSQITDHLGGVDNISAIEQSLLERFIHVEAIACAMEGEMRDGKPIHVPEYMSAVDRLHGLGRTLGLKRRARDLPSLAQIKADLEREPQP
jgi:hypothetical protein